jgi:phosphoserine phosphatase RsbU/P
MAFDHPSGSRTLETTMRVPSFSELERAGRVQRGIMPAVPSAPGYEFFAYYQPVYAVGGDYYDFVRLPYDRLGIVVGDVAGKGIQAAMMMAQFASETRHHIRLTSAPDTAAADLNGQLRGYDLEELFITLCLGVLEFGQRRFTYCSAGHPLPLIRRADGRIEEHGADGNSFPLGISPDAVYRQVSLDLEPGDAILIYSDGVTDAQNARGERYDSTEHPRLRDRLSLAGDGPKAIGRSIIRDFEDFSAGHAQFDDITLICFGPVTPPDSNRTLRKASL